jgi:hypothetical protein
MIRAPAVMLAAAASALALGSLPSPALASHNQIAMIEDGIHLASNPGQTLRTFRRLGANTVRVIVNWSSVAPHPLARHKPKFNARNPAAYPAGGWVRYDDIVRDAKKYGIQVDFTVSSGVPVWAEGKHIPHHLLTHTDRGWRPSAKDFGQFMVAMGRRYDGNYADPADSGKTLPRVSFWSIWNEPNFGEDLGPQAVNGSYVDVAPMMYRQLVAAAWNALHKTGHGHDKIIIGGLTARGQRSKPSRSNPAGHPGDFAQMKPLEFVRHLYCVDNSLRPMRGSAARKEGCPTTASASRRFRAKNPGLFRADGFAQHPYPHNLPPTQDSSNDPDYVSFNKLPKEERTLDRIMHDYGSGKRYPIYVDEYGYITHPPNRGPYVSPATAGYYINWAEYLSWRSRRIASTMQYLLYDPTPNSNGFDSGILFYNGKPKADYYAYRLPLYLPRTSMGRGRRVEVWGCARPATFMAKDTGTRQTVQIQFQRRPRGSFKTIKTVRVTNPWGYFDLRMRFPGTGTIRLSYRYPKTDPFLSIGNLGSRINSRPIKIRVG